MNMPVNCKRSYRARGIALAVFSAFSFAGAGCVELPLLWQQPKPPPPAPVSTKAEPVVPVTAEQVNDANARERAEALAKEIGAH
jgi:hypothetical protein